MEILALYQNKTGESLFDAINGEIGLGDARKELIEHLNTTLDKAFSFLSEKKDIVHYLSEFNNKTGLSLIESLSKNSGMPKDKKQAFIDKINIKMQEFIRSINADNVEDVLRFDADARTQHTVELETAVKILTANRVSRLSCLKIRPGA